MRQTLPFACLAVVLAGVALSLPRLPASTAPRGEEATHRLAAESLVAERDLVFDHRDLERGYRAWPSGPRGIALLSPDGGASFRFAVPMAASLAALPFVALFGRQGWLVANALFFVIAFAAAWRWGRGAGLAWPFVVGFFCASAALGQVFRFGPEAFRFAAVTLGLLAWQAIRKEEAPQRPLHLAALAVAGGLVAAAGTHAALDLLAGLVIAADLAWSRRGRPLLAFLAGGLAVFGGLLLVQHRLQGTAWPERGTPTSKTEVQRFYDEFPIEGPPELWSQMLPESAPSAAGERGVGPRLADAGTLLAGRTTGLLPFFPFALVALVAGAARGWDRRRVVLAVAVVLGLVVLVCAGGARPSGLGDPSFVGLYPLLFFLPPRIGSIPAFVGWAAGGLWTVPALLASLIAAPVATPAPAFSLLPLELRLAAGNRPGSPGGGLPGYGARVFGEAVWLLPEDAFFLGERNPRGVWMQGAGTADVIVVAPAPIERLTLTAVSLAADHELRLDGGAGVVRVRFDSAGKRAGTPIELPVETAGHDLGGFFPREIYYRLRLTVTGGLVPARRDPKSSDPRYLGVFLEAPPEGTTFLDTAGQGR